MQWNEIYNNLIQSRKKLTRVKGEVYYELHHIIPSCVGGKNIKDNLVLLTAREHFIAHLLLVNVYPKSNGMHHALWRMVHSPKYMERRISARQYAYIRAMHSDAMRYKRSEITKQKNSLANIGKAKSPDHCKKISESKKGHIPWNKGKKVPHIPWNKGLSSPLKGKKWSEIYGEEKSAKRSEIISRKKIGVKRPDLAQWNTDNLKGKVQWNKKNKNA